MLSFFRQLAERTDKLQLVDLAQQVAVERQLVAPFVDDSRDGSSKLMNNCSWSCRIRPQATASSGVTRRRWSTSRTACHKSSVLTNAGVFHLVRHLAYRREHGIDRNQADRRCRPDGFAMPARSPYRFDVSSMLSVAPCPGDRSPDQGP